MDGFGTSPFVLPNMFPAPGAVLQNEILRRDKQQENRLEAELKAKENQEKSQLYNLNRIRQATDLTKYDDVEQHVDAVSARELQKIQENALKNYTKLDPAQMEFLLNKDMSSFINWHTGAKQASKKINEDFKLFKDQYKNINPKQAYDVATNEFLKDFIDIGQSGELSYKDPVSIQPRDYVGLLETPEILGQLEVDTSPLQKALEAIPKTTVGDKEYTSNKGRVHKFDWSGLKTDYSELEEDERGRPKQFQLKAGSTIGGKKLIPEDLKKYLLTQPQVRTAVGKLWGDKKRELEAQGTKVNPQIETELFDMFLYDIANKHLPHDVRISEGQVVPKITVNTGKQTKAEIEAATPLDLTQYNQDGKNYDITELAPGIKVTGLPTGTTLAAQKILYNPDTKEVTYTDVQGNTKKQNFNTFRQNIATINTGVDLSFIDRLKVTGRPGESKTQPTGYSQITETNKGKIGVKNGKWYYVDTGKPAQ